MLTAIEIIREKAFALHAEGAHQKAVEDCFVALSVNPSVAWPYYLSGMCRMAQGRRQEARAFLARYLELDGQRFSFHRRQVMRILDQSDQNLTGAPER